MRCPDMKHAAKKGGCDKCGKKLVGRQRRWCSESCSTWFRNNHRWTDARKLAKHHAKIKARGPWVYLCAKCGLPTEDPEVNHIEPCLGAHGKISCFHHQSNLEVLCHSCHVQETKVQRAAGLLKKTRKSTRTKY